MNKMLDTYTLCRVSVRNQTKWSDIAAFLQRFNLGVDTDVERFIVAYSGEEIVACGGIAGNILKSIAIVEQLHGTGFSLKLMTELTSMAYEMGRYELFLFTKPQNVKLFRQSGFFPIAKVDGNLVLLENSQYRLRNYCRKLKKLKVDGNKVGGIVINANPFTLGHQYLIEQAAKDCDWLHIIVVKEEGSEFSYHDRFEMIKNGISHVRNITVHPGSSYIISRATFPTYFIKSQGLINYCHTAIDLQLFRHFIAPALGITHRYVGSEPECVVTSHYNQQMKHWLTTDDLKWPSIEVVEFERKTVQQQPISASTVRSLLKQGQLKQLASLLPQTSIDYIQRHQLFAAVRSGEFAAA